MKTVLHFVMTALLVGCFLPDALGGSLRIKGSNTFGEDLGPALIEGFKAEKPDVAVELESISSGVGIMALLNGACDIAPSSRMLNEDELRLAKSRQLRIEHHSVCYYGIAVVVQPGHPVRALTDKQIEAIFTGDITNWKEVGGPDQPMNVYIPPADAGTYLGFQELAMKNRPYAPRALTKKTYHDIGTVVRVDPLGIGFVSLTILRDLDLQGVLVNGIHPSSIAVIEGLYPYARMVRLFSRHGDASPEARAFIHYCQSKEGQAIVERIGFVPRNASPLDYGGF